MVVVRLPFITSTIVDGETIVLRIDEVDWFSFGRTEIEWKGMGKNVRRFPTFRDAAEAVKLKLIAAGRSVGIDFAARFRVHLSSPLEDRKVGTMEGTFVQLGEVKPYMFSPELVATPVEITPGSGHAQHGEWWELAELKPWISADAVNALDHEALRKELDLKIQQRQHRAKGPRSNRLEEGQVRPPDTRIRYRSLGAEVARNPDDGTFDYREIAFLAAQKCLTKPNKLGKKMVVWLRDESESRLPLVISQVEKREPSVDSAKEKSPKYLILTACDTTGLATKSLEQAEPVWFAPPSAAPSAAIPTQSDDSGHVAKYRSLSAPTYRSLSAPPPHDSDSQSAPAYRSLSADAPQGSDSGLSTLSLPLEKHVSEVAWFHEYAPRRWAEGCIVGSDSFDPKLHDAMLRAVQHMKPPGQSVREYWDALKMGDELPEILQKGEH